MKAAQLATGQTYEDKKGRTQRTIKQIVNGKVYYHEGSRSDSSGAQDFAAWAARPAGAKKPPKEKAGH